MWWQAIVALDRLELYRWNHAIPWDALGGKIDDTMWTIAIGRLLEVFKGAAPSGKTKEAGAPRAADVSQDEAVVYVHGKLQRCGVLTRDSTVEVWMMKRPRLDAPLGGLPGGTRGDR